MKQNSGHPLGIWRWSRANARRVKRYRWGLGYLTGNLALSRGVGHGSGYLRHFVWVGPSPQALSQASGHHRSGCCSATTGSRSCKRSRRLFRKRPPLLPPLRGPTLATHPFFSFGGGLFGSVKQGNSTKRPTCTFA